ncbi:MAG: alpha/beta hydrolase, partial [Alphaproteobacteria bacterium]|nr:alpha/beta hydrolase [Alphaproteobacteria bacterium]
MALDPESQKIIDAMVLANRPAWHTLSPEAAREAYLSLRPAAQGPRPDGVQVTSRSIPAPSSNPGGQMPIRIYRPERAAADARLPALVYAHGGGWVFGNLESHDVLCAQLAIDAGIVVVAIDYRLAPETRFPGAFDDVVAGLKWVAANGPMIGVDPSRLAIGGDSAGGNLAAAVAIWARDNANQEYKGPKLRMQLLAYPVTDAVDRTQSYKLFYEG